MKKRRIKLILAIISVVIGLLILFLGINAVEVFFEDHFMEDDEEYDDDDYYDEEDEYDEDDIELSDGQLLINGKVYNYNAAVRNYLIIGTDYSGSYLDDKKSDSEENYSGNMADVLLLVVLNRSDNSYAVLEIDRNTMMDVPMMNEDGSVYATALLQIAGAHGYGGNPQMSNENTVNAVSELLGRMPIDGYYELNMDAIEQLNHAIGGVTLTIDGDFSNIDSTLIEGQEITLNDKQAYNYVHARMGVGDGSNEGRMSRQETYIKAYLKKMMEKTEKDPGFPNEIFSKLKDVANTDMNGNDLSRVLNRVSCGQDLGIITFEGEHTVGVHTGDDLKHQEFYVDPDSLYDVMDRLYQLEPVK